MKVKKLPVLLAITLSASLCCSSQQGDWHMLKTTNEAGSRSECGMAAVNGKLYLIGGEGSTAVEVFDPRTLSWTKKAAAPSVMHHFEAVGYKDKVYVLDAFSQGNFPDQVPMANVRMYDTRKDLWSEGAAMPVERRRAGAGAAEYKGKLYLVAGIQHGHSSGTNGMFDEYDPQADTWTALPDAPHIRDHCSAAVVKDKLYVVGGRNTSYHEPGNFMSFFDKTVLDVDCFDFITGQWTTLKAKLPMGSGGGAVVNLNDRLYYMGGERATASAPNGPKKNTYYLDPSLQDEWKETDSLNQPRNGTAAVVLNNKIYLAGGAGGPGGPPPGLPGGPGGNPNGMPPPDAGNSPQQMPPMPLGDKTPAMPASAGNRDRDPQNRQPGNSRQQPQGGSAAMEVFTLK